MFFLLLLFSRTPYHPYIGGRGRIKMALSASTPSAIEPAKDLILVHTVQLKSMVKSTDLMVSSGISDVAIASVHSEKTRLKKLMMIIIMNKFARNDVF